jgi:hypothetical protein
MSIETRQSGIERSTVVRFALTGMLALLFIYADVFYLGAPFFHSLFAQ